VLNTGRYEMSRRSSLSNVPPPAPNNLTIRQPAETENSDGF